MAEKRKHRTVSLNPDAVVRLMDDELWSIEKLASHADLSPGTVSAAINGKHPVYWSTAENLRKAFKLDSLEPLLHSDAVAATNEDSPRIHEWLLDRPESKWITASNQLQFRIWRLQHEHLPKYGRGKCYDLEGMATEERSRCRSHLLRHAEVCSKIGRHPNIITNVTTCESPQKNGWWVIDEWIDGVTLSERMRQGSIDRREAIEISLQIAAGLNALNQCGIVRRELTPQSILLESNTNRVVLTEFELAKLLDGSPTVSNDDWPVDPYRAPEAGSDDVDHRADIYSWARITMQMLLGELPPEGDATTQLKAAKLPKQVESLLSKCAAVSRRARPDNLADVITALTSWRTS